MTAHYIDNIRTNTETLRIRPLVYRLRAVHEFELSQISRMFHSVLGVDCGLWTSRFV